MRKSLPLVVILGCAALFALGVAQLFKLRYDAGDVYAPYSSLRSDPLGTMALYESIDRLPGVSAQRDFSANNRLPEDANTTYLHFAASMYEWKRLPEDTFQEVEGFVKRGGRLVITLFPESSDDSTRYRREESQTNAEPAQEKKSKDAKDAKDIKKTDPKKAKKKKPSDDEDADFKTVSIEERWGAAFGITNLTRDEHDVYKPARVTNQTGLPLPPSLEWHSGIVFTNLDKAWQTIYARGTNAVVVERKFGRGTVVIATDSYFVSNEAMLKDRHADFLAWLVGSGKTVVFDEAHLGTMESSGVSGLMRKYHLYWLVGGLILLSALFIWKNSLSLVPPPAEESQQEYIAGKEAAAGFVNLLRRNIPVRNLLETCFAEWKKSAPQSGKYSAARLQHAEAIFQAEKSLPVNERYPLKAYQEISIALTNRNTEPATRNTSPNA